MAVTAAHIMTLAGRVLGDEDATRWRLPELCAWINEAVKAILLAKPSAYSTTITIDLISGTYQPLSDDCLALLRLVRNIKAATAPLVGGRIIRVTTREALDAQAPYWHDPDHTPYKKEVRQFVYDEEAPRSFYVYPGNDGTGHVEAVVSKLPTLISPSADEHALASYGQSIGLADTYLSPILDFVVFRAMSKDDVSANPLGAMAHYQAFAAAVGLKTQVEGANSPNSRPGVSST